MQIKSSFKDYYDKYQVYGHNVFIRNVIVESAEWKDRVFYGNYQLFRVGFCGEIYHGIYVHAYKHDEVSLSRNLKFPKDHDEIFVYTLDELLDYEREHYLYALMPNRTEYKREMGQFFKKETDNTQFIGHSAPIFFFLDEIQYHTMGRPKIGIKREIYTLEKFQFDKIKPANIAYMEIEQYINGVLTREHKEIPEMDNATKVAGHGFDKNSFRKRCT